MTLIALYWQLFDNILLLICFAWNVKLIVSRIFVFSFDFGLKNPLTQNINLINWVYLLCSNGLWQIHRQTKSHETLWNPNLNVSSDPYRGHIHVHVILMSNFSQKKKKTTTKNIVFNKSNKMGITSLGVHPSHTHPLLDDIYFLNH